MEKKEILYFLEPGIRNTEKILARCKKAFEELGLTYVLVAANTGYTAQRLVQAFEGLKANIIAITNAKDAKMPVSSLYTKYESSKILREKYVEEGVKHFPISLSDETLVELEGKGVRVFSLPDDFAIGGKPRPDVVTKKKRSKLDGFLPKHLRPLDIEAGVDLSLLNILSMGFRVCIGITAVAVKYDLIPSKETVLSIAGTGWAGGGADTAIIVEANPNPKNCYIREILGFPKSK